MPVNLKAPTPETLHPVNGIKLGATMAGIRKANRLDLLVITLDKGSSVAGVFTQNRFSAAPVQVCQKHLAQGHDIRALLINTGNANAGTGENGLKNTDITCQILAQHLGIAARQVLPFSTGVIMETLPVDRITAGIPDALSNLHTNNWSVAAQSIMTTDTIPKAVSQKINLGNTVVTVTGMSKGAGMIKPNMATMLGFLATDANIQADLLPALVSEAADASFNRITIDGDTSTNDSFILMSSCQASNSKITNLESPDAITLRAALISVSQQLAQAIVRDGEGATKFITIKIEGGKNNSECKKVAYAIAHSPLVKTAFFASDPNLGRILAAVGYAGIPDLDQRLIDLFLNDVHVVTQGGRHPQYLEEDGQRVMKQQEILVRVNLARGTATSTVWTCDFSHDYVTINADYRS